MRLWCFGLLRWRKRGFFASYFYKIAPREEMVERESVAGELVGGLVGVGRICVVGWGRVRRGRENGRDGGG